MAYDLKPVFTMEYDQPNEYRFSLDSVEAPKVVAQRCLCALKDDSELEKLKSYRVLDLCAGVGVMGLELSFYLPQIAEFHFVEVQSIYRSYFCENLKRRARSDWAVYFHEMNYEKLIADPKWRGQFDLVLCNPPYFVPGQGLLSPSEFKNRCRFFLDSSFEKLVQAIAWVLKPQGEAYVLIRDLKDHGLSHLQTLLPETQRHLKISKVADIRGTDLFCFEPFVEGKR